MKRDLFIFSFLFAIPQFGESQTWNCVGNGISGVITPACIVPSNKMYVGAGYSQVSFAGIPVKGICSFNGLSIDSLDSGLFGPASDVQWYNGKLIAAGDFAYAGANQWSIPYTARIAVWDSLTGWSSITPNGGVSSSIKCLESYNGSVYAGGQFVSINNISCSRIAQWNGSTWSTMNGGVSGSFESADAMTVYHGQLYVGGDFAYAGNNNLPARNIARWNGTQWDSVGRGMNGWITAMVVDTVNDVLYAAGQFTRAGDATAFGVAMWNDTVWSPVGTGTDTLWATQCLAMFNGELYAGGANVSISMQGDTLRNIYKYNGIKWVSVDGGANNSVMTMGVYQGNLYVGGSFWQVGQGVNANKIACYGNSCPVSVGISENLPPVPFRIFPNPNDDVLHIESEETQPMQFRLTNSAGQLIAEAIFISRFEYKIKGLAAGTYFVQVSLKDGSRRHTEKLVVK